MPARNAVTTLPEEVRRELDARLVSSGFGDYVALSDWLAEQGYSISKSAVHRYGQRLEAQIERVRIASEEARTLVEVSPDDVNAISDASLRMAQSKIFNLLLQIDDDKLNLPGLTQTIRGIAEASRAATTIRRERRAIEREVLVEASKRVGAGAKKAGLTKETEALIRGIIEGTGDQGAEGAET